MSRKNNQIMSASLASSLPTFSGEKDENISYFLNQLKEVAELEEWSPEKKLIILKLNLREKALKFAISVLEDSDANFDDLEKALIGKFSKDKNFNEIQKEFNDLKQLPTESVQSYAERVEKLANKFGNPSKSNNAEIKKLVNDLKFSKFVEGLRPDIKIDVKKMGPKEFKQAITLANNIQQALEDTDSVSVCNVIKRDNESELSVLLKSQFETNKALQQISENMSRLADNSLKPQVHEANSYNMQPSTSQNSIQSNYGDSVYCHICFKKGHLTTACWYFPQNEAPRGSMQHLSRGHNRNLRNVSNFRPNLRNNFKVKSRKNFQGARRPNQGRHYYKRHENNSNLN